MAMDLIDQIRSAREADSLAPFSQATLTDISQLGTSVDLHGPIAANGSDDRVEALLQGATNFDLLRAYQHNDGLLAGWEIAALATELRRRDIRI